MTAFGLGFTEALFDGFAPMQQNHCAFCFMTSKPARANAQFDVKDDDYRLQLSLPPRYYLPAHTSSNAPTGSASKNSGSPRCLFSVHATEPALPQPPAGQIRRPVPDQLGSVCRTAPADSMLQVVGRRA